MISSATAATVPAKLDIRPCSGSADVILKIIYGRFTDDPWNTVEHCGEQDMRKKKVLACFA
jgi:hypothetical protein